MARNNPLTKERYIINAKGERVEVILSLADYIRLRAAAGETDPDAGRALKKSFLDELARQEKKNKRGKPFKDAVKQLGLD
jgi:hypothetical protein